MNDDSYELYVQNALQELQKRIKKFSKDLLYLEKSTYLSALTTICSYPLEDFLICLCQSLADKSSAPFLLEDVLNEIKRKVLLKISN